MRVFVYIFTYSVPKHYLNQCWHIFPAKLYPNPSEIQTNIRDSTVYSCPLSVPDRPHVGSRNLAIREVTTLNQRSRVQMLSTKCQPFCPGLDTGYVVQIPPLHKFAANLFKFAGIRKVDIELPMSREQRTNCIHPIRKICNTILILQFQLFAKHIETDTKCPVIGCRRFHTHLLEFRLKCHQSLFLRVKLTISQHWFG